MMFYTYIKYILIIFTLLALSIFNFILCVCVFSLHACLCMSVYLVPAVPRREHWIPGSKVTDDCKQPRG